MRKYDGQGALPLHNVIVVGGQWGSEGKGAVINEIGPDFTTHVRVGGPQAGHSVKLTPDRPDSDVLKLQTIPVGAVHGAECLIGMASVVDPEVLEREHGQRRCSSPGLGNKASPPDQQGHADRERGENDQAQGDRQRSKPCRPDALRDNTHPGKGLGIGLALELA